MEGWVGRWVGVVRGEWEGELGWVGGEVGLCPAARFREGPEFLVESGPKRGVTKGAYPDREAKAVARPGGHPVPEGLGEDTPKEGR